MEFDLRAHNQKDSVLKVYRVSKKDSHQLKISCRKNLCESFSLSRKLQSSKNMFSLQFWKVFQNLFITHPTPKPTQYINYRNTGSFYTGFTKSNIRIKRNIVWGFLGLLGFRFGQFIHTKDLRFRESFVKMFLNYRAGVKL